MSLMLLNCVIVFSVKLKAMDTPLDTSNMDCSTDMSSILIPGISALISSSNCSVESCYFNAIAHAYHEGGYDAGCKVAKSLKECAKLIGADFNKNTYLKAVRLGSRNLLKILIENTCDDKDAYLMCVDDTNNTILMYAASPLLRGDCDKSRAGTVDYILNHSGLAQDKTESLVLTKNTKGETVLHEAARNGLEEVVSVVLAWAKQNNQLWQVIVAQDYLDNTPLHVASAENNAGVVELLLQAAGEAVNEYIEIQNNERRTARNYWTWTGMQIRLKSFGKKTDESKS